MRILIFIIITVLLSMPEYTDDEAFCEDPKMWAYFETLVQENPNDVPLHILHALKIGLCKKVEQNTIRMGEAIEIFNDMVDTVAHKRESGDTEKQTL